MVKVQVRVFASLAEALGFRTRDVEADVKTVRDLISHLSAATGVDLASLLLDKSGSVKKFYKILVNGRDVEFLAGLNTELRDGDVVAMFPPIAGGSGVGGRVGCRRLSRAP